MNRSLIAAVALAAGVAIAAPTLVWSADGDAQLAQADSDQHGPGGMMGWRGHEGMGHHGWMHEMHEAMMRRSPRERCEERLAHRAGIIAYTVTKLNLTAEQRPLWDRLNGIVQGATDKERQLCASMPKDAQQGQQTLLDRVNQREQFLTTRLQALQQARPALEALYQALTPEQKAIIDHPFRR